MQEQALLLLMLVDELLPFMFVSLRAYELEWFQVHMLFDVFKEIWEQKIGSFAEPQRHSRHKIMLIRVCIGIKLK